MMARTTAARGSEVSRSHLRGPVLRMKNKLLAGPLQDWPLNPIEKRADVIRSEKIFAQRSQPRTFPARHAWIVVRRSIVGATGARMIIPTDAASPECGHVVPGIARLRSGLARGQRKIRRIALTSTQGVSPGQARKLRRPG
jgi:hypothetical protein